MSEKKINRLVASLVFILTLAVYLRTLSTTVVFWDVGEFCAAARLLQIPHPPGAPLFILVARLASLIPFREDIAARMHAVSALGSALGVMFLYLISVILIKKFRGAIISGFDRLVVYGSSAVGALTLAFSTTYWDNSIEAEVYGLGMFFVALCFWLTLHWSEHADEPGNERYLLLVAYLLGLATGVHILALLVTIPLMMIVYFRTTGFSVKGFVRFSLLALGLFIVIYPGIIQILPRLLAGEFLGFKSSLLHMIPPLVIILALVGIYRSYKRQQRVLHIACLSFLLIVLGYTTYIQVIVRANVDNLPMDEADPSTLARFTSYVTREQYGETPIFRGESWDNGTQAYVEKLFPRRWSREAMHEPTRTEYASDADFLWRYQVQHMFLRYILWNFVGAEGQWQDAGVTWKNTLGLPLIVSLLGFIYILKKDWKTASVLVAIFIVMGVLLDLYQNQQDPQPRERDYFYVGAYFAMCVWVSFGVVALLEYCKTIVKRAESARLVMGSLLTVLVLAVPGNLLRLNWNDHDRSGSFLAWDYSYNLLQSVDRDGILFTNGDNDTFPLWYLQDVEGIRRDVRIVNLSLSNIPWYLHLIKNRTPYGTRPISLSLTDQQIDRIRAIRWEPQNVSIPVPRDAAERFGVHDSLILNSGRMTWEVKGLPLTSDIRYVRIQDIIVKDIITLNTWDRPIFFSATCSPQSKIGLDDYLWMEGLAYRLKPVRSGTQGGGTDIALMEKNFLAANVVPAKYYQPGFLFRNLSLRGVTYDDNAEHLMMNYRMGFMRIANYYLRTKNDKRKTLQVLDSMESSMPITALPMQNWVSAYYIARIYADAGDRNHFELYAGVVEARCRELIATGETELQDNTANPYIILSEIYAMRKDYSRAIDVLSAYSNQNPNTPGVKERIELYDHLRRTPQAVDSIPH